MTGELVDIVDKRGTIIGVTTRSDMRARNLRHRSVGIVVRSLDGQSVLVHQRADWKDVWPSRWDVAFGGVCARGEDWEVAALRELNEEAGLVVQGRDLRPIGRGSYEDERVRVVTQIFEVRHNGPFVYADGEVAAAEWIPVNALGRWTKTHQLCDDSAELVLPLLVPTPGG